MDIRSNIGCNERHITRALAMYCSGASTQDFHDAFGENAALAWCAAVTIDRLYLNSPKAAQANKAHNK